MLEIISNGSKWNGEKPDSIDILIEVLKDYALDPMFEECGDFVNHNPTWLNPEAKEKYKNCTEIFGNFLTLSHVFNIITDDKNIIDKLAKCIQDNKSTGEYIRAKKEYFGEEEHNKQLRKQFENNEISQKEMYELGA